jgi:D-alanine-D-alanine ligase
MANGFTPVIHGAALDRPDEQDTVTTAGAVADSLQRLGYRSEIVVVDPSLVALPQLAARRPLVVFNLVEALGGDSALASVALAAMDRLGLTLTGAGADAYASSGSKLTAKARLAACAIPTPACWPRGEGVPAGTTVIVKAVDEHGSLGMDGGCIVPGERAAAEIRAREARFGGRFFAEQYIAGREFNAALIETSTGIRVLPLQEIDFSALPADCPPIVDYAAKWDPAARSYHLTPRRFGLERREPKLARELARIARASWHAFGLAGYARVDFRLAGDGTPYVLEVNANPCLAPDAGFMAAAAQAGHSYDDIIARIVRAAMPAAQKAA